MVQIRSWAHLSIQHIKSARRFRDQANKIESIYTDRDDIPQDEAEKYRIYSMNSILATSNFINTYIEEFVSDICDDKSKIDNGESATHHPNIKPEYRNKIANASNIDNRLRCSPAPGKYNVVLDIADINKFDEAPMEQMHLLNRLRNEIIHFNPQWTEGGQSKTYTNDEYGFEEDLKGRFDLNPLMADGNAFFPSQCISYGCAKWSLRYGRSLVYHFSNKIGVELHPEVHT
jgi:hypothetical protein